MFSNLTTWQSAFNHYHHKAWQSFRIKTRKDSASHVFGSFNIFCCLTLVSTDQYIGDNFFATCLLASLSNSATADSSTFPGQQSFENFSQLPLFILLTSSQENRVCGLACLLMITSSFLTPSRPPETRK